MDKKTASIANAPANASDNYWLACIARHNQDDLASKAKGPAAVSSKPTDAHTIPDKPAPKSYPRNPVDSFWLKQQIDTHHDGAVKSSEFADDLGLPQGDARVGIPAHIAYTAIIDDGQTHHMAWSIRNMSLSGVLLEMDISHLREGQIVDFLLRFTRMNRAVDRRIPAKVVRTQLNGLALQFNYYDAAACRDLADLLYSN